LGRQENNIMPAHRDYIVYGVPVSSCVYTRDELRAGWNDTQGQGNKHARERNFYCVTVFGITEEQALTLSALFCRTCFNITTCCHYAPADRSLGLYCGDAGQGADSLLKSCMNMVAAWKTHMLPDPYAELFADETPSWEGNGDEAIQVSSVGFRLHSERREAEDPKQNRWQPSPSR
jgi:hypothetical protein